MENEDNSFETCYFKKNLSLKGHNDLVISVIYFPSPINRLVSTSLDKKIRIWDSITGENVNVIEVGRFHSQVIKWSDRIFMTVGRGKEVFSYDIEEGKKLKVFSFSDAYNLQMMKIDNDRFLLSSSNNELLIISYEKNEIVKQLENQAHWNDAGKLVLSKVFNNCFYMNANRSWGDGSNSSAYMKLINHKPDPSGKVEAKIIAEQRKDPTIWGVSTLVNHKKEEILFYSGSPAFILVYNMGNSISEINPIQIQFIEPEKSIICSTIHNNYLFVGTDIGKIQLYKFSGNKLVDSKIEYKPHNKRVFEIIIMKETQNKLMICSCSSGNDSHFSTSDVFGLDLTNQSKFEISDLKERIEFLIEEEEEYFFNDDLKKYLINVKFNNNEFRGTLKVLLLN